LDPDAGPVLNNLAYLLGEKLDRPAEALPYAQRAQRLEPDNVRVLDTLGWILVKNDRLGEAIGMLLRALEIERKSVPVLYHLGLAHMKRGELEEARLRLTAARDAAGDKSPELPKINKALEDLERAGG
jgi:Tfp pilus assembly protein PilF